MPRLTKRYALKLIADALSQLDVVDGGPPFSRAFNEWQSGTLSSVRRIFGDGSKRSTDFERIPYSSPIVTSYSSEEPDAELFRIGLSIARRQLGAMDAELRTHGLPVSAAQWRKTESRIMGWFVMPLVVLILGTWIVKKAHLDAGHEGMNPRYNARQEILGDIAMPLDKCAQAVGLFPSEIASGASDAEVRAAMSREFEPCRQLEERRRVDVDRITANFDSALGNLYNRFITDAIDHGMKPEASKLRAWTDTMLALSERGDSLRHRLLTYANP